MSTKKSEPEIKSCGVLVFRNQPKKSFLLMEHSNRWDLPKGHVDPGESDIETALRELQEETGISANQIELDPDFRFSHVYQVKKKRYGKRLVQKELVIFLGLLVDDFASEEIVLTEHIGYRWFPWQPPHSIQTATIDPLLDFVTRFWNPQNSS